jgi:hypothetical protein
MLKTELKKYIEEQLENTASGEKEPIPFKIYREEKDFLEKQPSIMNDLEKPVTLVEMDSLSRFDDAYIERCEKESEELIAEESSTFLDQPIDYFLQHLEEFMYLESSWFDIIGVDAISFEVDSVFKTYDVMLGLKLQKKFESSIKNFLAARLKGEEVTFDLMFNSDEGIWDLNFSLNNLEHYKPAWTIREAYDEVYRLLFQLREFVEDGVK